MSFKSKKPPEAPQLPAQPVQQELMDVIDEITGTKTTTVTDGNGRRYRTTTRLPLSEHEKEMLAKAEQLMSKSLNNIEALYKYDPMSVVDYQPFINTFADINNERMAQLAQIGDFRDIDLKIKDFKDIQEQLINDEFDKAEKQMESGLAYRGVEDSTGANERRAAFANQRALAQRQANVEADLLAQDMMDKQLTRENAVYDTHEKGRLGRLQQAQVDMDLQERMQAEQERKRQQAISEQMNWYDMGSKVKAAENDRAKLALYGNQLNNSLFGMVNQNQNQRYANDINRTVNQYDMDLSRFNSMKPTFGQQLADIGLKAGASWLSAPGGGFDKAMNVFANKASNTGGVKDTVPVSNTTFGLNQGRNDAFRGLMRLGRW